MVTVLLGSVAAQSLPRTEGKTLAEKSIVVADAVKGQPTLLVVTFSKSAGEKAAQWTKALQEKGLLNARLAFYEIAELEDVPRLFRGMAVSGMRKGVPSERHATFVILTSDTDAWKKFVNFDKDENPYLVFLDANGNASFRVAGDKSDERLKQLAEKMK